MSKKRAVLPKFEPREVLADLGTLYTVRMSVAEWISVPNHPRQRDTDRQSRKPHWDMARLAQGPVLAALRSVTAGELDGQLHKVDGHTRALLWSCGELPDPEFVIATVYRCKSREELTALYNAFDTPLAAKTKFDEVSGAFREHGLQLSSQRLKDGMIVDALSIALRGVARSNEKGTAGKDEMDIGAAVKFFASELQLLDSIHPTSTNFYSGVVAGALLALALDPEVISFFAQLAEPPEGQENPGRLNPVAALLAELAKLKGKGSARIKEHNEDLAGQTVRAAWAWKAGEGSPEYWTSDTLQPVVLADVIREVNVRKATLPSG